MLGIEFDKYRSNFRNIFRVGNKKEKLIDKMLAMIILLFHFWFLFISSNICVFVFSVVC